MKKDKVLSGVRVLDFGAFLAGPVASMILANLGAEVIKVENPKMPDGSRFFVTAVGVPPPDMRFGAQLYDASNFNKLGVSIDISTPEGKELLLSLAKHSDIILENMAPGTMAKHGLSYQEVVKRRQDIIYLSSTACGQYGPERDFIGYAATFANKSGLGHITGYPGSPPSTFVGSIDIRSAVTSVVAVLSALYYRDETGQGQYIDVASQEAIAAQLGDVYIDYIANGVIQGPQVNRREGYAPQGAFPSAGTDQWVAISVSTQKEWEAFCAAMGNPGLAGDPRFATYAGRRENWEPLEALISEWTAPQDKYDVVKTLQAAGVPSGPVLNSEGLAFDEHIQGRGCFVPIEHPDMGMDYAVNSPWRFSETPSGPERHAPILGQHTTQVLKNILGMKDPEINALAGKKVIRRLFD